MSPCRWDFISDNRADFGVKRICRVLGASRADYYRHLATEQARAERQAEEKRTVSEIRAIHTEHHGAYGAPRERAQDQPQACHPADADQPHRRPAPAEEETDDDRGQERTDRLELFRWLSYSNRRRRHSALGYRTPAKFEQQLITTRTLSLVA